jgi:hypothetical protein
MLSASDVLIYPLLLFTGFVVVLVLLEFVDVMAFVSV